MNKLFISGNLTKDPELRVNANGDGICNFTVAVTRRGGGEPQTDYFRVGAFGQLGDRCQEYLHKGDRCNVLGSVRLDIYEDKNSGKTHATMCVNASEVEFLTRAER